MTLFNDRPSKSISSGGSVRLAVAANDPKDPPQPPSELFPFDEMSTGETSSLIRRAHALTGQPDQPVKKPVAPKEKEPLKPMTGAQLAFRPSAPPRQPGGTGSFAPLKPGAGQGKPQTGQQPAFKPQTGQQPAFKPTTGVQPAFTPTAGSRAVTSTQPAFRPASGSQPAHKPGTGSQPAFRPTPPAAPPPSDEPEDDDPPPVFDLERLQAQIRSMSLTDSALGLAQGKVKPTKAPSSAAEDTFVKSKMKEAQKKVPDFSLDDDLG